MVAEKKTLYPQGWHLNGQFSPGLKKKKNSREAEKSTEWLIAKPHQQVHIPRRSD